MRERKVLLEQFVTQSEDAVASDKKKAANLARVKIARALHPNGDNASWKLLAMLPAQNVEATRPEVAFA